MRFGRRPVTLVAITDEPDDGLRAHVTGNDLHGYRAGVYRKDDGYVFVQAFAKTADEARTKAADLLRQARADRALVAATEVDEVIR